MMSKKTNKKDLVSFLGVGVLLILTAVALFKGTHPKFDEKISGKEATIVSGIVTIHYDEPLGRGIDTVARSQKVILTGKMVYFLQNDMPMLEVRLENGSLAWIYKKDIVISE